MRISLCCLILSIVLVQPSLADDVQIAERLHTTVQFDLLLPRQRANGLAAQQWGQEFERLGVLLHVRQPLFNDKIGVEQNVFGTIRKVRVTAHLDPSGKIVLPDRQFKRTDIRKLAEWIDELKKFGARGAPADQPLWGLTEAEFTKLLNNLKSTVEVESFQGRPALVIAQLDLPKEYPLEFTPEAAAILQRISPAESNEDLGLRLQGVSKGTAAAIVLRYYGLSMSPKRLPDESVVLEIEPVDEQEKVWPIGWDPKAMKLNKLKIAPKLYSLDSIEIEDMPMRDFLKLAAEKSELDVILDPQAITTLDLKLDKLVVNYPRKKTTWSICLRTVLTQLRMFKELRTDENDRPFLWVTRLTARRQPEPVR